MLALALRNLLVRKARTALATAGLTIALLGIIALISVSSGIEELLAQTLELIPGVMVLQKEIPSPALSTIDEGLQEEIAGIEGVAHVVPQIFFPAAEVDGRNLILAGDPFQLYILVGVESERVAALPGGGLFARSLLRGRANRGDAAEVMLPADAVEAFGKDVGDTIHIVGNDLEVVGVFKVGSLLLDRGLIVPMQLARKIRRMPEGLVSALYLELDDGADAEVVSQAIEAKVPTVRARTTEDTSKDFQGIWSQVDLMLAAIAAIAVVVGAVGIVNTMLMSVVERTRELGVLRAVGWRKGDVVRLVMLESAILGVLGGVAGCTLGGVGVALASLFLPLAPVASPGLLMTCGVLAVLLGAAGGVYPAWRAAGLDPIKAIRT